MSFRTVVITSKSKLSYKNGYMIFRGEKVEKIHISELNLLVIDTTAVSITSYLICELTKAKVKIIFCDENMNPSSEVISYYGSHNTSKRVREQILWKTNNKEEVWTSIVKRKIKNQINVLKKINKSEFTLLEKYLMETEHFDVTNREGHSAKVYFNAMFGKKFTRDEKNDVNSALNYGYTILLSTFNKEIVSKGYITQLGINHKNQFNHFNFSSDLMEPFRFIVDEHVLKNTKRKLDHNYKMELIGLLNSTIKINNKEHFVTSAINVYLNSIFNALNKGAINEILYCDTYEE